MRQAPVEGVQGRDLTSKPITNSLKPRPLTLNWAPEVLNIPAPILHERECACWTARNLTILNSVTGSPSKALPNDASHMKLLN